MADWQVTATTVYCVDVDDEVTLLIYGDGTSKCTGQPKYSRPHQAAAQALNRKRKQTGKPLGCRGDTCQIIASYREKWLGK